MTNTTKTTYTAAAPDGTEFTRTTATREYTHAVLVYGPTWKNAEPHWGVVSFHSTANLAATAATKWANPNRQAIVVPAVETKTWTVNPRAGRGTTCIGSSKWVREVATEAEYEARKHNRFDYDPWTCKHCGKTVNTFQYGHKVRAHKA